MKISLKISKIFCLKDFNLRCIGPKFERTIQLILYLHIDSLLLVTINRVPNILCSGINFCDKNSGNQFYKDQ